MSSLPASTDNASVNNNEDTANNNNMSAGNLEICILSAYDLVAREPPKCVEITVAGQTVRSGPPIQRHKDRNSFKFASGGTTTTTTTPNNGNSGAASNVQYIVAPLSELYAAKATLRIIYDTQPGQDVNPEPLVAEYELSQLHIHETKWLVLNLENGASSSPLDPTTTLAEDASSFRVLPTIRLKLTLHGPYRTEIATAMHMAIVWFQFVDKLETSGAVVVKNLPDPKWFLVPAAPLLALAVVSTPVVAGILVVALPMVLPALVVVAVAAVALGASALLLYASTKQGRQEWLQPLLGPVATTLLSTPTGQHLVYQTGPRPTPVHLCRIILPQDSLWGRLIVSLWIDLIGSSSYLLPVVGEGFDLIWAPIQTILIMALYDDITPNLKYVSFIEEILPFTDIVPSATIGWLAEFGVPWAQQQLGWKIGDDDVAGGSERGGAGPELLMTSTPLTPFSTPR